MIVQMKNLQGEECQPQQTERRLHRRYPITLQIEYRALGGATSQYRCGLGKTVNVSSGGVLFEADDTLPAGGRIKILMDWPVRLDDECPLRLVMWGSVVRRNGRFVAVWVLRYEFHTAAARMAGE